VGGDGPFGWGPDALTVGRSDWTMVVVLVLEGMYEVVKGYRSGRR
jgi:hypothetical protein